MFKPLKVILVYFVCLIFTGCEKSEKKEESVQAAAPQAASSEASESPELSEFKARIGIVADRYFLGNSAAKNEWIKMQMQAFDSISSYIPDVDLQKFSEIRESAKKKNPEDYVKAYNDMLRQIDGLKSLDKSKYSNAAAYEFAIKHLGELYPGDYVEQSRQIAKWIDFYSELSAFSGNLSADAAGDFKKKRTGKGFKKYQLRQELFEFPKICDGAVEGKENKKYDAREYL